MLNVDEVAGAIHHSYFRPSPLAVTFTVAVAPSATFTLAGCFVIFSEDEAFS